MKNMSEEEIIASMAKDRKLRRAITKRSFYFFFIFYFPTYIKFPMAHFHRELITMAEDEDIQNLIVSGFRGCGKSTIISLAFVIWDALGKHKAHHILILGKNEAKVQEILKQIKGELETNDLLKSDLGPFKEEGNQWNVRSLIIEKGNVKITIASTEQSVRGIRHQSHRPDIIIADDIEDTDSVRTQESRDKMHNWLTHEVLPAGDLNTSSSLSVIPFMMTLYLIVLSKWLVKEPIRSSS